MPQYASLQRPALLSSRKSPQARTHFSRHVSQLESSLSLQKAHDEEVATWRSKHSALQNELAEVSTSASATVGAKLFDFVSGEGEFACSSVVVISSSIGGSSISSNKHWVTLWA
jgi:predicted oxidoreductase